MFCLFSIGVVFRFSFVFFHTPIFFVFARILGEEKYTKRGFLTFAVSSKGGSKEIFLHADEKFACRVCLSGYFKKMSFDNITQSST